MLSGSGRVKLDDEILEIETHDAIRVAPSVTRAWEAGADGLELLAFGPRHEDDGEVVLDWWTERSPRSIPLQAARSELSAGGPELDT